MGSGISLSSLSAQDIHDAVLSLGKSYEGYAQSLLDDGINGAVIIDVGNIDEILDEIGVAKKIHRSKLRVMFEGIHASTGKAPCSPQPQPACTPTPTPSAVQARVEHTDHASVLAHVSVDEINKLSAIDDDVHFVPPSKQPAMQAADKAFRVLESSIATNSAWTMQEISELNEVAEVTTHKISEYVTKVSTEEATRKMVNDFLASEATGESALYRACFDKTGTEGFDDFSVADQVIDHCKAHVPDTDVMQPAGDVVMLYRTACEVKPIFDELMRDLHHTVRQEHGGIELTIAPLKHIYRVMEKMAFSIKFENRTDGVLDVVRCLFVCPTKRDMVAVLELLANSKDLTIVRIKDRWRNPTSAGWRDFMVNVFLNSAPNRHKCEIQITHKKLYAARKNLDEHESYVATRAATEIMEKLSGGATAHDNPICKHLRECKREYDAKRRQRAPGKELKTLKQKVDELAKAAHVYDDLKSQLETALKAEDYDLYEVIQNKMDESLQVLGKCRNSRGHEPKPEARAQDKQEKTMQQKPAAIEAQQQSQEQALQAPKAAAAAADVKECLLNLLRTGVKKDIASYRVKMSPDGSSVVELDLKMLDLQVDVASLAPVLGPELRKLELNENKRLTGDVRAFESLEELTTLNLHNCKCLTGDVAAFAGLVNLTKLDLYECSKLTGDVAAIANLVNLTALDFADCDKLTGKSSLPRKRLVGHFCLSEKFLWGHQCPFETF